MNKKILTLSLICISTVLSVQLTLAGGPSEIITVWTDKPEYSSGQTGKLYITYNNIRDNNVTIRNITVVFKEWWAYNEIKHAWVGNLTYEPSENEKTIAAQNIRVFEISFTVPSDGRAGNTDIEITVYTNLPTSDAPSEPLTIYMVETPIYMERIITLFTILVVLLIICTIIIATTMFLSAQRPQAMWREAEKTE